MESSKIVGSFNLDARGECTSLSFQSLHESKSFPRSVTASDSKHHKFGQCAPPKGKQRMNKATPQRIVMHLEANDADMVLRLYADFTSTFDVTID